MHLDHIGVAVTSITDASKLYVDGLNFAPLGREIVADQGVTVLKLDVGNTHVELLEPLVAGEGPIAKFLDKRGPGIHHLCFRVDDIVATAARLKSLGYRPLTDAPTPGANGCLVLFLHPKDTLGTLIELSQPPRTADATGPSGATGASEHSGSAGH